MHSPKNTHSHRSLPVYLEDINSQKLAEEFGLEEYRLPETYYIQAATMLEEFYNTLGKNTITQDPEDLGDFLMENTDKIMTILGRYPDMWRLPLCLRDEDVRTHIATPLINGVAFRGIKGNGENEKLPENILRNIQESPIPSDASDAEITTYISRAIDNTFVIISFALFVLRGRKFEMLTEKYGQTIEGKDTIKSHIHDEAQYQIESSWATRYATLLKRILGKDNFEKFIPNIKRGSVVVKNIQMYRQETKKYWRGSLPYERILIQNEASEENPERDLEGMNFFLCQTDLYGYDPLIIGMAKDSQAHIGNWKVWIKKYIEKILDPKSEVHKLFLYIFTIENIFLDGELSEEARNSIPTELHKTLEVGFENHKRKEGLKKQKNHTRNIVTEIVAGPTKSPVQEKEKLYLAGIRLDESRDIIHFDNGLPEDTKSIEVRIYKNEKVTGFGIHDSKPEGVLELTKKSFINRHISAENPILLGEKIGYKPGEKYDIGITAVLSSGGRSEEFRTGVFTIPKVKKELPIVPKIQEGVAVILGSAPTLLPKSEILTPEAQKKEKEKNEKEDLQTAIELFLDNSDSFLGDFLQDHAIWDGHIQALTLHIPIEELEEMGYSPALLSVSAYGPLIQWKVIKQNGKWIPDGEVAPQKIQAFYESIFRTLAQKIEQGEIDNYLSECGLSPSETSDNSTLRGAIRIDENIDTRHLTAGITKIAEKYKQEEAQYNLYCGPLTKSKVPTSITWFSKKKWHATLTLHPTVALNFSAEKNQPLPYDATLLAQRIENALLNFVYQFIKNGKGVSGIIKRTSAQEDTKKLRESYRRELKKKTARLLIENADGITFTILEGITTECLAETIKNAQMQYGKENIALLYRRNTYTFLGDTSICKPSQSRSEEDYTSLNIPERRNILRERILKTLFNGKSGIQDRAPFLYGSAVYHALQFEMKAFQEKNDRTITHQDITDDFLERFIALLRSGQVLISYRDYCAGEVEDLTDLLVAE